MRISTTAAALALCTASIQATADTLGAVGEECMAAIEAENHDRVAELAPEFLNADDIIYGPARLQGQKCLAAATGDKWAYLPEEKRYVRDTVLEAQQLLRREGEKNEAELKAIAAETVREMARAREALRRADLTRLRARTLSACNALLARDEIAALTNPICQKAFEANGLPEG